MEKVSFTVGNKKYAFEPNKDSYKLFDSDKNAFYFDFLTPCKYQFYKHNGDNTIPICFPVVNSHEKIDIKNKEIYCFSAFNPVFTVVDKLTKIGKNFTFEQDKLSKIRIIKGQKQNESIIKELNEKQQKKAVKDLLEYKCIYLKLEYLNNILNFNQKQAFRNLLLYLHLL